MPLSRLLLCVNKSPSSFLFERESVCERERKIERDWEREHHVRGEEEEEVLLTAYNK